MHYKKHTLPNGVRVVIAPMADTQTATVLVMTGAGSRYESRRENGIAHFLEHMFFKGTKRRPTALDISKELDGLGAEYNAFTGKEYTGYYAKVEARHWDTALDIVSDLFLHATLPQEEIDRERGPIIQEISMYEDMPMRHIGDLWERHLYGDHPLGWEITGPKDNIRRFNRKDFVKFLERCYTGDNIVVGVAGNVDPRAVLAAVRRHFAGVAHAPRPSYKRIVERPQKVPGIFVQRKKTDQTHFILGVRAYHAEHPKRYALGLLATILGGGMSSRLFLEVRERRGLAYSVHASVDASHDAGYLAAQCGVQHDNLEKTIGVIMDELRKVRDELVPDDELAKAKEYVKGKMAMALEGSDEVAEYLVAQEVLRDKIVSPEEKRRRVDAVTPEQIREVAREIFRDDRLNLAVIAPRPHAARIAKLLTFEQSSSNN